MAIIIYTHSQFSAQLMTLLTWISMLAYLGMHEDASPFRIGVVKQVLRVGIPTLTCKNGTSSVSSSNRAVNRTE